MREEGQKFSAGVRGIPADRAIPNSSDDQMPNLSNDKPTSTVRHRCLPQHVAGRVYATDIPDSTEYETSAIREER